MNLDEYEKMTWETPSDELDDAVEDLLAEVKRLREAITSIVNTLGTDVDDANLVAACLGALKGMIE
jgi:hypothetical protein